MRASMGSWRRRPRGFTLIEMVMAMAVIAVAMLIVAQVATSSMVQRLHLAARSAALEHAANVLEGARAVGADGLTQEWAAEQRRLPLPAALPADSRIDIEIEAAAAAPTLRRVTVQVGWRFHEEEAPHSVQLAGFFAPREEKGATE